MASEPVLHLDWRGGFIAATVCAAFALTGCDQQTSVSEGTSKEQAGPSDSLDPLAILQGMVDRYRRATSYQDQGVFHLQYRQGGQTSTDEAPFSVAFERPNRLAVNAYHARMKCDGEHLRAQIQDKLTRDLDGQVLVANAEDGWDLDSLFHDAVLRDVVIQGLGRHPLPLELLLAKTPLEAIFRDETTRRLLEPARLRDRGCVRVAAETGEGRFVFWIEQQTSLLLRLEYPPQVFSAEISDPSISDVRVFADFRQVSIDGPIDRAAFEFAVDDHLTPVAALRIPPRPLPSELLGRQPAPFTFAKPGEADVTQSSLNGQIATLLWFNDHPLGKSALQQLDAVFAELGEHNRLQFLAVCTEPSSRANSELAARIAGWNVQLPWARDLEACGRDVFKIPGAPTLIVLDADGSVQAFEVGFNPNLGSDLPDLLRRLEAGEDVAGELLLSQRAAQQEYDRHLNAGAIGDDRRRHSRLD